MSRVSVLTLIIGRPFRADPVLLTSPGKATIEKMAWMTGLTLISFAMAVSLSALIRLIQSSQLRQRVRMGQTGIRELAELSGIMDVRDLQDQFGPPGLNRIWSNVTLGMIEEKRDLAGYLMSAPRLHMFSMLAGLAALLLPHWSTQSALLLAGLIQSGAWVSASRLPR